MLSRVATPLIAALSLAACTTPQGGLDEGPSPVTVQLLALNDFHGNLETPQSAYSYRDGDRDGQSRLGGAAQLGATLDALREANSLTVAAGDLIGASPLISSLFLDEPTVRVLSEVGLDVASVGNHEFDRGIAELLRMQGGGCEQHTRRQPCQLEPFTGADFTYLAGNVVDDTGATPFPATTMREVGGARIGFIGLTLKETGNLVAAQATAGYQFLDEAETANRLAAGLRAEGADAVVLLIHQGGDVQPLYNVSGCPELSGPIVDIAMALDPAISVVVSGHTHQAYVCTLETAAGDDLLLTSAGRYGGFVTDIELAVDPQENRVIARSATNVPVLPDAGTHAVADAIVRRYAEAAGPVANRAVGSIAPASAVGEDCMDDTAEDLVADAHLAAARAAMEFDVDFAMVNSGGVRTDLGGADDGVLTYGEIAAMQPFNNGLIVVSLTGAEIKAVLEQQYCGENPAAVCQSVLIPSANVSYEVDLSRPVSIRVDRVTIDGQPLDRERTYTVAINSFLAGGGDGFSIFGEAEQRGNAGFDVDALEAYVAGNDLSVPICGRVKNVTP